MKPDIPAVFHLRGFYLGVILGQSSKTMSHLEGMLKIKWDLRELQQTEVYIGNNMNNA